MSLLDNAIDAVICGVEDYQKGTEARYKSALRNVYAGLLLILKEKLRSLAPEIGDLMISKNSVPVLEDGRVIWVAKGHKTADTHTLKERFKSLGIEFDWKKFDEISDVRNDIEHKYTELKAEAIRELLTKSFVMLCKFMTNELSLELKEELGDSIYNVFVEIKEIYEAEKAKCSESWKTFGTESTIMNALPKDLFCPECASGLVILNDDGSLDCKFCNEHSAHELVVEAFVKNHFKFDNYELVKEAGNPASIDCPACDRATLVIEELVCACCGETFFSDCQVCSATIPISEIDGSGICGWCQSQIEKND